MSTYILESLEAGSHGIIPNEGINYFVGQKNITIMKDGKKVLDKEIVLNPDGTITKYNLLCDDDKDPVLEPVKDVEEYNVANMLPQVIPEETVLNKNNMIGTTDVKEYSSGKVSINDNISFLKNYIADCKAKIASLKTSKAAGTDLKIQTLKARLEDAESKLKAYNLAPVAASDNSIEINGEPVTEFDFTNDLNIMIENCNNILTKISSMSDINESLDDNIDDSIIMESTNDVIEENALTDAAKKVSKIAKSELNKIGKLASEKLELVKDLKNETDKLNKIDIKKNIVKNQKEFRDTIKNFSTKYKEKIKAFYKKVDSGSLSPFELQRQIDEFTQ